jgi:hypothetical protein
MSSLESGTSPATSAAGAAASLRPLSIGELFDRAFNLYFRHVLTFAAILLVMVIPFALIQYFMYKDTLGASMDVIQAVAQHPGNPPDLSKLQAAQDNPLVYVLLPFYYLFAFFAVPLANAAVVSGVSRAYLGLPVRFADCYRHAFSRWGWVLLLVLLWGAIIFLLVFAVVFAIVLIAVALGTLAALIKTPGEVIAAIVGIGMFLAFLALIVMLYMAFASSFIATVLEKVDPLRGFVLGVTRIFGGRQFWRSFLVACALLVIGLAFALVAAAAGGLASYATKAPLLYLLIANVAQIFFTAFAFTVVALYYYDIRIRREGFDLQLLAEQLPAARPPTPPAAT